MAKITKEMQDNIANYGDDFLTLTPTEGVRQNIGTYLGYSGNRGFINMIREIFQNSADELMKKDSPCDEIWVYYDERNHEVTIQDNGRGIPFDIMVTAFTSQNTSTNYEKKPGAFSSGRHGLGSKATSACSEHFVVKSYRLGKGQEMSLYLGDPETAKVKSIPNKDNYQGTIITFNPIHTMPTKKQGYNGYQAGKVIMGEITTTWQDVLDLLESLIPLLDIGAKVNYFGTDANGKCHKVRIVNDKGIAGILDSLATKPMIAPIHISKLKEDGQMKADILFTFDSTKADDIFAGYANFCPTPSGTHIKGFVEGLTKFFRDYMNKYFLGKNSKLKITNADILSGLCCVNSVYHLYPEFTGQAKEIISNEDLVPFVKDITIDGLDQWAKTSSSDLQKLCKYFKEVAELRTKNEAGRVRIQVKNASAITGLPAKFVRPKGKKHNELFIVEGDSAAGNARNRRDNDSQGIFPIRGKIISALAKKREDVLKNEEVASIISIIGAGYGKNFDISKCNWERVVICTDADPDGAHIRTLLLSFFLLYMEPLVLDGRVYASVPPLYGGKIDGRNFKYFTDRTEYNAYLQKQFSKNHKVTLPGKVNFTNNQLIKLLNSTEFYIERLESAANSFAINPYLLEEILLYVGKGLSFSQFKSKITKNHKYLECKNDKGNWTITGLYEDNKYQTIYINDRLLSFFETMHYKLVTDIISSQPSHYVVDGVTMSLYGLLNKFKELAPKNITRFKGLGEMNEDQLYDTVIGKDKERVLEQYTVEDIKYEIAKIREIDSSKMDLIAGLDISNYIF